MRGKLKIVFAVLAVLLVTAGVSFVTVVTLAGKNDNIFQGVSVKGIQLGGKSRQEAGKELIDYINSMRDKKFTVIFEGGHGSFKLADVDFKVDTNLILDKAWEVGRQGNFIEQWKERREVAKNGYDLPVNYTLSKAKFKSLIDKMTKKVRTQAKDARIIITPQETVQIVESTNGKEVDSEDAYLQLKNIIDEESKPEIRLAMVDVKPKLSTEDARKLKVTGPIASFTTHFDLKKVNRTFNVKVAASAIDGKVVLPGETFSFNDVVGPRSVEAGYKEAKTIINNEFVDSLGGGVCQVSSTLYNALLQANVKILHRSNHSLVIKYVPLGQDAAVAFGSKDLKFKNTLPCAIVIKSSINGSNLTIKLFGDITLKKSVRVINNIVKEYPFKTVYKYDPTLPKGKQVVSQRGENGYRVNSVLLVYQGGRLISKKNLPSSYYKPLDKIILVGTAGVPNSAKPVANKGVPASGTN